MESGRYEILGLLGKGGCGTVYRARFLGEGAFQKEVALKILHVEEDDEMARRLRDEARILALLHHRAIVKVDRLVRLDGRWTVVMELVRGVDLRRLVEQAPLPLGAALEIVAEVAGALLVAWGSTGPDGRPLHLVHRDIKPSNLLLTAFGEIKVLDFGIARAEFSSREAETSAVAFGSLDYMSPERLDFFENTPGPEGDVYGLGLVLYELLTTQPFGRTSPVRKKHDDRLAEAMGNVRAQLGERAEPVVELLERLLAYEESTRPDAREVERQCRALRNRLDPEGSLRDTAERLVPDLLASTEQDDPDVGRILEERTEGHKNPFLAVSQQHSSPPLPPVLEDEDATDLLVIGRDLNLPPEDPTTDVDEPTDPAVLAPHRTRSVVEDRRWQAPEVATPAPPPPAAPPVAAPAPVQRKGDGSPWIVFVVGLAGMLTLGVIGAWWLLREPDAPTAPTPSAVSAPTPPAKATPTTPTPPATPAPAAPSASPAPEASPSKAPTPATPSAGPSSSASPSAPATSTRTPATTPARPSETTVSAPVAPAAPVEPAPAETSTGTGDASVSVKGDVEFATLEGTSGFFYVPGPVPPGHYVISANFGGQTVGAGAITLKAGERVTLRCTAADTTCSR